MWNVGSNPYEDAMIPTPGPLATALVAMLGNESWFALARAANSSETAVTAYEAMCQGGPPFGRLSTGIFIPEGLVCNDIAGVIQEWGGGQITLATVVYQWFSYFGQSNYWQELLGSAVFFSHKAHLMQTAAATQNMAARPIYSATGQGFVKPAVSLPAKIVISVLVGAQVLALLALCAFIYSTPTFGSRISATSMMIIGAQLKNKIGKEMPHLGLVGEQALEKLEKFDGLVGIEPREEMEMTDIENAQDMTVSCASSSMTEVESVQPLRTTDPVLQRGGRSMVGNVPVPPMLAVGAPGIIPRRRAKTSPSQAISNT